MKKTIEVCDYCQSREDVSYYRIPWPEQIAVCGGSGMKPEIKIGDIKCREIALCPQCSEKMWWHLFLKNNPERSH